MGVEVEEDMGEGRHKGKPLYGRGRLYIHDLLPWFRFQDDHSLCRFRLPVQK